NRARQGLSARKRLNVILIKVNLPIDFFRRDRLELRTERRDRSFVTEDHASKGRQFLRLVATHAAEGFSQCLWIDFRIIKMGIQKQLSFLQRRTPEVQAADVN